MKIAIALFAFALMLFGCIGEQYDSIKDIKENPDTYLGEKVTVKGAVKKSIKLGKLSGFTLEGDNESIFVSSELLPPEDVEVTVEGTVMQELLIGHYILAKDIEMT